MSSTAVSLSRFAGFASGDHMTAGRLFFRSRGTVNAIQLASNIGKEGVCMQREIPMMSTARRPKEVDPQLLAVCRHRLDAIRLCIQLSGLSNETVAEELGLDKGHLSRIMQGKAYFPDTRTVRLMELCGNIAPMQWEAQAMGYQLSADSKAQRKAELLAELAQLEAA